MSENHTPGPWRSKTERGECVVIGLPTWPCNRFGKKGEWDIATLDDLGGDKPREMKANARLIAAAPELLAACEGLLERYRIMVAADGPEAMFAAHAIAKATGAT